MTNMSDPIAFICFNPELHQAHFDQFLEEMRLSPVAFTVDESSMARRFPSEDWHKLVRGKIARCNLMIVIIGRDPGPQDFIANEIRVAKAANVPFFGVLAPDVDSSSSLPDALPPNRTIPWEWARIGSGVEQLMSEGKNHKFK
jgi:hypothetical protein